jgi:hypothetical protein
MTAPTLTVTNHATRRLHGPGRLFTIMARPRYFERGVGTVRLLCPTEDALLALQAGTLSMEAYRARFEAHLAAVALDLAPGRLTALLLEPAGVGDTWAPVRDGDTLACACSRAEAAMGRCHRAWCAPALVRAGWRVVFDGVEVVL